MSVAGMSSTCEHRWDEFHVYEVVCSRCRQCREYTQEDDANLTRLAMGLDSNDTKEAHI